MQLAALHFRTAVAQVWDENYLPRSGNEESASKQRTNPWKPASSDDFTFSSHLDKSHKGRNTGRRRSFRAYRSRVILSPAAWSTHPCAWPCLCHLGCQLPDHHLACRKLGRPSLQTIGLLIRDAPLTASTTQHQHFHLQEPGTPISRLNRRGIGIGHPDILGFFHQP